MPITELLERNAREFPKDIALVEINPDIQEKRRVTWRDYELIQPDARHHYRRDITWHVFNEKANRVANLLISRGIRKGDKVAILMMNCLEWLPIYFGILKTGALAVPMNFRFDAQEIKYCLELSETDVLIFGPEFVGRIEEIVDEIDEKLFESELMTSDLPDVDLMVRTSGEQRLSNFLLWQLAYAEFVFTDVFWPDFNDDELLKAIWLYQNRDRRFGGLK